MATNNNVLNVQFLRNQTPYQNRLEAINAIESAATGVTLDGTALLARYQGTNEIITLVGYVYVSGNTHDLTLIDIEGASADVQALREEINAKLGTTFISSGNTVEANLTALSGTSADASGVTSVWGAKAYADDLISNLDFTDTAVSGNYVSKVDQVDGVIAVTREALPTVADSASAKTFVTSVSENLGEISVSKGSIESSAGTIVLTDTEDGGVNFEVHIDGVSILKNAQGELSVANSALIQYAGDEKTINVSEAVAGVKTISSLLTLVSGTPSSEIVKEEYALKNASGETIGDTIKIYKDSHIVSITYITDSGDTHYQNLEYVYIDASGNTQTTYVDMSELVLETEFASGVTVTDGIAHGVVDQTSESFLTVGENGFKLSGVQDAIDAAVEGAVSGLDATVTAETANHHISISIEEEDGKLVQSGLTITESDIASADDLEELSAKTVTEIGSSNSSIAVSTAATTADDGTVKYDVITDASKIQMSGFTSNDGVLSGITPASSVTEAFEEVDKIITENEEVTSAALNDLDARIKTVSGDVETLTGSSLSGITVNGNAVTPTSGVAPLVIDSATSAMTAESTEAIVVDTDANGNITLGLAAIDCGYYD